MGFAPIARALAGRAPLAASLEFRGIEHLTSRESSHERRRSRARARGAGRLTNGGVRTANDPRVQGQLTMKERKADGYSARAPMDGASTRGPLSPPRSSLGSVWHVRVRAALPHCARRPLAARTADRGRGHGAGIGRAARHRRCSPDRQSAQVGASGVVAASRSVAGGRRSSTSALDDCLASDRRRRGRLAAGSTLLAAWSRIPLPWGLFTRRPAARCLKGACVPSEPRVDDKELP